MGKAQPPVTPAVRALRAAGVAFTDHLYDYEEKRGTAVRARELGVDEHCVVKTLVMEDDRQQPLLVLNGGKRGYLVGIAPADVNRLLKPRLVRFGLPG